MKKTKKKITKNNPVILTNKKYLSAEEALFSIKQNSKAKFDESIEVHCKLGINPKDGEQHIRGNITLPHPVLKLKKIVIFTDDLPTITKNNLNITHGTQELINTIKQTGKIDFDLAIATPQMMPKLAIIAKVLGPKGLMPSPKTDTVTTNIIKTIEAICQGRDQLKNDNTGNVHFVIGKKSFDSQQLLDNLKIFISTLKKLKPSGIKGAFIRSAYLCSTMGKSIQVDINMGI